MPIKAVFFDWDQTLAPHRNTNKQLFPGASELLSSLHQANIDLFIITARPAKDPTDEIYQILLQSNVMIQRESVFWVGSQVYQGHELSGNAKADKIECVRQANQWTEKEILFVDDHHVYVAQVRSSGVMAMQVPPEHLGSSQRELSGRKEFFKLVEGVVLERLNDNNELLEGVVPLEEASSYTQSRYQPMPANKSQSLSATSAISLGIGIALGAMLLAVVTIALLLATGGAAGALILSAMGAMTASLGVGFIPACVGVVAGILALGAGLGLLGAKLFSTKPPLACVPSTIVSSTESVNHSLGGSSRKSRRESRSSQEKSPVRPLSASAAASEVRTPDYSPSPPRNRRV